MAEGPTALRWRLESPRLLRREAFGALPASARTTCDLGSQPQRHSPPAGGCSAELGYQRARGKYFHRPSPQLTRLHRALKFTRFNNRGSRESSLLPRSNHLGYHRRHRGDDGMQMKESSLSNSAGHGGRGDHEPIRIEDLTGHHAALDESFANLSRASVDISLIAIEVEFRLAPNR